MRVGITRQQKGGRCGREPWLAGCRSRTLAPKDQAELWQAHDRDNKHCRCYKCHCIPQKQKCVAHYCAATGMIALGSTYIGNDEVSPPQCPHKQCKEWKEQEVDEEVPEVAPDLPPQVSWLRHKQTPDRAKAVYRDHKNQRHGKQDDVVDNHQCIPNDCCIVLDASVCSAAR
mmetsp:Transcript_61631/g.118783  ORF Transcript_61631/g.118783 Transcript_61631/m.118783 type:complete len:172 (-) Transcript_61631:102-617(-)